MAESLNRRDIDMIFRAETDSATRSVGVLKKSIGDLRKELDSQVAAAERGEGSLEELAITTRKLKDAQDELGTARSLLTQLNTQQGSFDKTAARAEKLGQELAELQAKEAAAEKPTKRLTTAIANKERALASATEKVERDGQALAAYRAKVEAIVGPVDKLEDSFREVAKVSKDAAQGLAISGNAADTFADKARQAAAANAELAQFEKIGRDAGLGAEDIAYLSQFEDRIERVTAARNEQIAADLRYQAGLESLATEQVQAVNQQIAADLRFQAALEQTRQAQERLAATNAFRQTAEQAREAFRDVSRFGAETVDAESSTRRLATAVAALANPARAAANDMAKVGEVVDRVEASLQKGGKRRTGELSTDLNDLEQALAGLQRQAAQVDGLLAQQKVAQAAEAAFASAKAEVFQFANALDQAGADGTPELVAGLAQAEAGAERAGRAFQVEATKLKQLEAAAAAAAIDVRNLDAAERQIIGTSQRAGKSADFLRRQLGGGKGSGAFLGLKPHELQNIGFQINDIFVSLASGQNPLTVLVQQGAQIGQVIPGAFTAVFKAAKFLSPVIAIVVALGLGMARAAEQAQRAREVASALTQMGVSGKASAGGVEDAIANLDDLGASAADAKSAILTLVKEGMDPKFFDDFGAAALAFSEITGEELPAATERLVAGLTKGRDEVLALDDEFGFLTESEREQIRAMDDSTDAAEIRTIAFDAFHRQAIATAEELRGPSKDAVESLEASWSDFLDTLADVAGFDDVDQWLADTTNGVAVFVTFLSGAIRQLKASFGKLAEVANSPGGFTKAGGLFKVLNDISTGEKSASELLAEAQGTVVANRNARRNRRTTRTSRGDVGAGTRGSRGVRESVADRKTPKPKKPGKSDAEKLAEELLREQEQLQRALEQMTAKALGFQQESIEAQLANAATIVETEYAKLFRQLDEFGKKFGATATIGGLTQTEYRAQLDRNKQIITQRAQLQVYESSINDLMEERTRRLKQIEDRQKAGLITAKEALDQTVASTQELNPAIEKAARDARAFAVALGGANPSPELRAFIASLDGISTRLSETESDVRAVAENSLNEMESKRNKILARRAGLVEANNALVELGLKTQREATAEAEEAFNREAGALQELIRLEREYLAVLLEKGLIEQTEFDSRMAQLTALGAQTQYVSAEFVQMKSAIDQAITQEAIAFFDAFAQSLANAVVGASSVGDALADIGRAFLTMIANLLRTVATLILQMLILSAVEKATGIPVGALLRAMYGGGGGSGGGSIGMNHGGGTIGGSGGRMRRSNFDLAGAALAQGSVPRYHNGTEGAGLRRNEMLTVLERGEKVVTQEQQRLEAKRSQGGASSGTRLRQVLAFGDSEVAAAMSGPAGEDVTVTHIRRNKSRIRQELGID